MTRLSFLFLVLACVLLSIQSIAQHEYPVIVLNDHFNKITVDTSICYWKSNHDSSTPVDKVWDAFRSHLFIRYKNTDQLGSRFKRGYYDYWVALCIENNSDRDQNLILNGLYGSQSAFHRTQGRMDSILGMFGTAAYYDPNHIISVRWRSGFTFKIEANRVDTILVKIHSASMHFDLSMTIYDAAYFDHQQNATLNTPTLFNGIFLGILMTFLIAAAYFYVLSKQSFVKWYSFYIILLIVYYWRDFETWNNYFNFSHTHISWDDTKVILGYLIFLSYNYFINDILGITAKYPFAKKWLRWVTIAFPLTWALDILLRVYYPYGSYILMYGFGIIAGLAQVILFIPLLMDNKEDRILKIIASGSIILFLGWLTIPILPTEIHRIVIRATTLIELTIFMLAMVERSIQLYRNQQNEIIEKKYAVQAERDRIASEMHDDLGGGLTTIKYLSMQGQAHTNQSILKDIFSKIGDMSNDITSKISEIVWVLNEKNETLEQLIYYLRPKIHDQLILHHIAFELKQKIDQPMLEIKSEFRRDILLCISESINNVIKHAHATQVSMVVNENRDHFILSITDNGRSPIDINMHHSGNGLTNLRNRIRRWSGQVEWRSVNGSEVSFKVPINNISNRQLTKVI